MLSLYEILKASKTGIAPDMWTALAGKNWDGADSGHEVKELTGIPPLSFTTDGTPLLDYLIKGNTVQNGTPSPSNPVDVNGVGDIINLFDNNAIGAIYPDPNSSTVRTGIVISNLEINSDYYFNFDVITSTQIFYARFNGDVRLDSSSFNTREPVLIPMTGANSIRFWVAENKSWNGVRNIMLSKSSTAIPYEPYGYKIPILCGNQTTNIYLGETQSTRAVKKLVLTGEENWEQQSGQTADYFRISNMAVLPSKVFCTHFLSPDTDINYASTVTGIKMQQSSSYGVILACRPPNVTGLANFKSFLATQYANGTPVTVWYVLATPETGIVNEPLMKIGDYVDSISMEQAGVSIPTVSGTNVIDVETTLKPSEMYIKYQE